MPSYNYNGGSNNNAYIPNYYANGNQSGRYQYPPQPPAFNSYATNNLLANSPYNNYMGMNNGYQNQGQNNNNASSVYLKCRPVSSQEEARACQIDLDGSLWVFTDVGNKKIYTKQVDVNGLAVFNTYSLDAEAQVGSNTQTSPAAPQYITKEEFDKTVLTLATAIKNLQGRGEQQNETASPQLDLSNLR